MATFGGRVLFITLALCWSLAKAEVAVPPLTAHIIDQTSTLTTDQQQVLEQTLQAFEMRKGSQLAVLIVPTTNPEAIEQFSIRVAEKWKLGRKKVDDGVILIVAKDDRTLRIEVGYGLEGALNDATSKRIISEIITPSFKQGDFYGGINAGVSQIIQVIDGEPLPEPSTKNSNSSVGIQQYFPIIFIFALVIGRVLRSALGRFPGAIVTGGVIAFLAWFFAGALSIALMAGVVALLFTLLSSSMTGAMLLGSLGRGRGGFGSGGFGGGGGGFGGGGASGRW